MKNKNPTIELYRFLFMSSVAVMHFFEAFLGANEDITIENPIILQRGGVIGVDFFFILSGFLMYMSWSDRPERRKEAPSRAAYLYTWRRMKRFAFHYILSILLLMIYRAVTRHWSVKDWIHSLYQYKYEFMMFQMGGVESIRLNTPVWYVSALVLMGFFVYYLLNKNEDLFFGLIAPGCILLSIEYFTNANGGSQAPGWGTWNGLFIKGWIRGFMELSIGVLSCKLYKCIEDHPIRGAVRGALSLAELGAVAFCFYSTQIRYTANDIFCCFVFSFMIITAFLDNTWLNSLCRAMGRLTRFLGGITYPMLCYHRLFIWIFVEQTGIKSLAILPAWFAVTIAFSAGMQILENMLRSKKVLTAGRS